MSCVVTQRTSLDILSAMMARTDTYAGRASADFFRKALVWAASAAPKEELQCKRYVCVSKTTQ